MGIHYLYCLTSYIYTTFVGMDAIYIFDRLQDIIDDTSIIRLLLNFFPCCHYIMRMNSTFVNPTYKFQFKQVAALAKGPALLVATPGRLLDLLDSNALNLNAVRYVVLDEADKMLSLGFAPQLDRLHGLLIAGRVPAVAAAAAAGGDKKKKKPKAGEREAKIDGDSGSAGSRPQVRSGNVFHIDLV